MSTQAQVRAPVRKLPAALREALGELPPSACAVALVLWYEQRPFSVTNMADHTVMSPQTTSYAFKRLREETSLLAIERAPESPHAKRYGLAIPTDENDDELDE